MVYNRTKVTNCGSDRPYWNSNSAHAFPYCKILTDDLIVSSFHKLTIMTMTRPSWSGLFRLPSKVTVYLNAVRLEENKASCIRLRGVRSAKLATSLKWMHYWCVVALVIHNVYATHEHGGVHTKSTATFTIPFFSERTQTLFWMACRTAVFQVNC